MGKVIEEKILTAYKGMTTDARIQDFAHAQMIKNMDAHSFLSKMVPFRDSEDGDSNSATRQKQAFVIALWGPTGTYNLFALGVKSGASTAEIHFKTTGTGGAADLSDNTWTSPTANQSSAGATSFNVFVYYKQVGKIYGARAGTNIWAFTPDGATAWDDSAGTFNYTTIAQGLVHSKDDILYIPYDNKIASKNGAAAFNATALTLPQDKVISSICEHGNYLAIATKPISGSGKSVVYLWDRDASLTTISDSIDWGNGLLQILEDLDGTLVGVSFLNETFTTKIIFRSWVAGPESVVFKELTSVQTSTASNDLLVQSKQKVDNRLYFLLSLKLNGVLEQGLWKIGKVNGQFAVTLDRTPNNDTALVSGILSGFFIHKDYTFISYQTNGAFALSKTNDQYSFTASGVYESIIINGGDSSLKKDLLGITLMTEPLASGAQVIVKYKTDQNTTFTTLFTSNALNAISYSVSKQSGLLPTEFKELVLRFETKGGAIVTGLSWKIDITDKRPY